MRTKKILSILLASAMTLGLLVGCSSTTEENQNDGTNQTAQSEADTTNDTASESSDAATSEKMSSTNEATDTTDNATTSKDGGKNILIVYYSATGTTKAVANSIASVTGGDLFEIEPAEPYSSDDLDWTNDNSRVTKEHENEAERNVELTSTTVENWDSYGTVFIGYPIWWGIAAWPVDTFVKANDFTGKTVIPFCTSASSGLGESGELLAEMAGTGEWQEGERFSAGSSESDIQEWIEGLGITK